MKQVPSLGCRTVAPPRRSSPTVIVYRQILRHAKFRKQGEGEPKNLGSAPTLPYASRKEVEGSGLVAPVLLGVFQFSWTPTAVASLGFESAPIAPAWGSIIDQHGGQILHRFTSLVHYVISQYQYCSQARVIIVRAIPSHSLDLTHASSAPLPTPSIVTNEKRIGAGRRILRCGVDFQTWQAHPLPRTLTVGILAGLELRGDGSWRTQPLRRAPPGPSAPRQRPHHRSPASLRL